MIHGSKRQGPSPWALASGALHALTLTALVFALGRSGAPTLPAGETAVHNHAGRRLLEAGSVRELLGLSAGAVDNAGCIKVVTEVSGTGANQVYKRSVKFTCPIVVDTARAAACNAAGSDPLSSCADTAKPAVAIVQGAQAVAAPLLSATPANSGNAAAFNGPISVDLSNYVDGTTWLKGHNANKDTPVLNVEVKASQGAADIRGPVSIDLSKYNTTNDWLDALWIVQAPPSAVKTANPPIGNHGIHIKGAGGAGDNNAAFYVDGTTWLTGANANKDTSVLNVEVKASQGAADIRGPVSIDLSKYSTTNAWLDALWIVQAPANAVPVANPPIGNHGIHIKGNGGGNDNNAALYVAGNSHMVGTYANPTTPALFVQADRNQNGVQIAGRVNPKVNALQVTQGFTDLRGGKTTVGELEAASVTSKHIRGIDLIWLAVGVA
ncbi:hypothetical protein COHA_009074 [Chlorella ohadii]|uniref:Uncharacterized protein n=1 Tax=Chlorella ohadii TaxID=2649997 RepID=A0AAD5DJ17_9CHLO|nr:hypothetical protein COHA_009074 [Chlorella ohadii]